MRTMPHATTTGHNAPPLAQDGTGGQKSERPEEVSGPIPTFLACDFVPPPKPDPNQ